MEWDVWGLAAVGGLMIGAAAASLLALTGKTAGISGIVDGVVRGEKFEFSWKLAFVLGLVSGGVWCSCCRAIWPSRACARCRSWLRPGCWSGSARAWAAAARAGTAYAGSGD